MSGHNSVSWDTRLAATRRESSLVKIAREQRLVRVTSHGPVQVSLTGVDEDALALLDLAIDKGHGITFVYPAPAGEVAVLLAAQLLLRRFVLGEINASVGLLTADTVGASKAWEGLQITTTGARVPISEVFPCYRSDPEGESPFGNRRCPRGILIGSKYRSWRVDQVVVDHLAGPVYDEPEACAVRVFADPLDPVLGQLAARGELIWGWSPADLNRDIVEDDAGMSEFVTPFSVTRDRLAAIARGIQTTIFVVDDGRIEACLRRLRDDLYTLASLYRPLEPPHGVLRGLRVAWHHVSTLASLPCRPSDYDRFAGVPPIAARATSTFEREIGAWADTLVGDANEIASIITSDLGDLRVLLDDCPPFSPALANARKESEATVVVLRSRTAGRALLHTLGGDPDSDHIGSMHVRTIYKLHREGTWNKAIVVGAPPRWDWHRLDSGLSRNLHVLVLGRADAEWSTRTLSMLHDARIRWGSRETQTRVLRELMGGDIAFEDDVYEDSLDIRVIDLGNTSRELVKDPFESLEPLLDSMPLQVGGDDQEEVIAQEGENGVWVAAVPAVRILTTRGTIMLPSQRTVEVRDGEKITDCRAGALQPGMLLFVGRREGRLGLLDAVADRLQKRRPDLLAAHLLISDLQTTIRGKFLASSMTKLQVYEKLRALGCDKSYQAVRGYLDEDGPLAPRDLADLRRLATVLDIGWSDLRIREAFGGVQRYRTFRRAAGRALAQAAHGAVAALDVSRVDPSTGLSLADLRDAIVEAEVLSVTECSEPVQLSEIGRLIQVA